MPSVPQLKYTKIARVIIIMIVTMYCYLLGTALRKRETVIYSKKDIYSSFIAYTRTHVFEVEFLQR